MKILTADQYIMCCGLLRTAALIYRDIQVTSANSIDEVLASIRKLPDLDLVVLDASMPGMENFDGLRRVVENLHDVPVIVTSPSENHTQIFAAIRNGARGYIPPSSKPCVLQHALPLVMAGGFYIPASALLRSKKLGALRASERLSPRMTSSLTQRQHEITVMLADGKSNKEIARELKLLEGTVEIHVRGVLRNLGVRNRTEAAVAAVRAGYLPKRTLRPGLPTLEYAGGDGDHKTPGASASSPLSQSGTKHTPPTSCGPPLLPACSAPNAYDAAELHLGRLHRRTRGQRPIRIAVIDDHPIFRDGAVQSLTCMDGIEVVGEGATAAEALKVAEELRPDVILLDISIPGSGIEAAANIARACPSVRTVMLTASESEHDVSSALQAGARGYILKGSSGAEVVETVRAVFRGEPYVAPCLAAQLLTQMGKRTEVVANEPAIDLTTREEEILAFVSSGMTNKEIANRLRLTEKTVTYHMTSIRRKAKVRNRVEAVLMFRRRAGSSRSFHPHRQH